MGTEGQQPSNRGKKSRDGTEISYQNKDITMKHFADRLKGKTLSVVGLKDIEIEEVLPTNLPIIEANELRLDNLFKLTTGEYAIVDYESVYSEDNKVKYIGYIARVSQRLYNEYGEFKPLKIIVIYTADISLGMTDPMIDMGDISVRITEAFLAGLDSKDIRDRLTAKIKSGESFTDEDMMSLAIYPLTYRGNEAKQNAVTEAIDLAEGIADEKMMLDTMMGILTFSDKVIVEEDARRIRRRLSMTKVERIIEEEKDQAVKTAIAEKEQAVKTAEEDRAKAENRANLAEMELARYKAAYGELA